MELKKRIILLFNLFKGNNTLAKNIHLFQQFGIPKETPSYEILEYIIENINDEQTLNEIKSLLESKLLPLIDRKLSFPLSCNTGFYVYPEEKYLILIIFMNEDETIKIQLYDPKTDSIVSEFSKNEIDNLEYNIETKKEMKNTVNLLANNFFK